MLKGYIVVIRKNGNLFSFNYHDEITTKMKHFDDITKATKYLIKKSNKFSFFSGYIKYADSDNTIVLINSNHEYIVKE